MITKRGSLFGGFLLCALVCFAATAFGQGSQQIANDKGQAYTLVDEVATGALSLKLPENRAFMLASAADLIWPNDEKRARALFWDALGAINLMSIQTVGATTTQSEEVIQKSFFAKFALRQDLLRKVARSDPNFALEILRATREPPPEQVTADYRLPDDSDLEQQIATEAAVRDPVRGLKLARESLAKGLSARLIELLYRLNQSDKEVAAKFAGEIIDKLQATNLMTDLLGSRMAINLVVWSRPEKRDPTEGVSTTKAHQLPLDHDQRRRLVEMIANAALALSANSTLLNSINEVRPEIQEFVPERVALLERKLARFDQTLNKEQKSWNDYNEVVRNGTPEQMLAAATRNDDELRRMLQQQAIIAAVHRKRADALRDFISAEIHDESTRQSLLDELDRQQINAAVSRGDAEQLRKVLNHTRRKEERARAMAEIALLLEKKGDHEEAVKLIDEARSLIKIDVDGETQTDALLALVGAYTIIDPAKAFAIMERTIDRANDQIAKALLLDKIVRTGVVKQGEIVLQHSGAMTPDLIMLRYGKAVAALANADFHRTRAAADRLDRNELRLFARLLLAQSLLRQNQTERKAR